MALDRRDPRELNSNRPILPLGEHQYPSGLTRRPHTAISVDSGVRLSPGWVGSQSQLNTGLTRGSPTDKVYFNHKTGKAEKCTLCYPRIEVGLPTICAETCVGRIRYLGLVLYDADRVLEAASTPDEKDLLNAQLSVFLDPEDPEVRAQASRDGIPDDWLEYARRSPVYALAMRYRVALPLHPEYRTLPMVWYVPPLSPVVNALEGDGYEADPDDVFPAIEMMRIPVQYLANLLTAGDSEVIKAVLHRLAAMRAYMRKRQILDETDSEVARAVGMAPPELEDMYRLLAIAKYDDRYVIPKAHTELAQRLSEQPGTCGLDFEGGPGNCGALPRPEESLNERFMMLRQLPVVGPQAAAE